MSTAYYDNKTAVGLILGTGSNACYIETVDRISTLDIAVDHKYVRTENE